MSRVAYAAFKNEFIKDVIYNRFIGKMKEGARKNHIPCSGPEVRSWESNAPKIQNLLSVSNVDDSVYVSFEYKVPNGGRIDCILYGIGLNDVQNVVHIELKQWGNDTVEELYDNGVFNVHALTGGAFRPVCHPSQQVENYQRHLLNYVEELQKPGTCLEGLAYCYNYDSTQEPHALYANHYRTILDKHRLYSGNELEELADKIHSLLCKGTGLEIFNRITKSRIRQSDALLNAAAGMFSGVSKFSLLDDQITASNAIFAEVEKAQNRKGKTVIVVKGGPGTGKTVIALDVLANMAKKKKTRIIYFTTRSKALRESLKTRLSEVHMENGSVGNASDLITDIYDFKPYHYKEGEIDLLLVDEAHRVERSANHFTDSFEEQTYLSMSHSLMYCSKVCVFFIDDKQAIKSTEIGNSNDIIAAANNYRESVNDYENSEFYKKLELVKRSLERNEKKRESLASMTDADSLKVLADLDRKIEVQKREVSVKSHNAECVHSYITDPIRTVEIELKSQFRCNGSDNYLDWLDEALYRTSKDVVTTFSREEYQFEVCETPDDLEQKIRDLDHPDEEPAQVARIVAGYCWRWSDALLPNGDLAKDVKIGDWEMPWETKNSRPRGIYRDRYASSADTWAIEPQGINQIGCIFSVQGFELDYIGVIIGPDIKYDSSRDCLVGVIGKNIAVTSSDPDVYTKHVLNAYRVLMSRGRKGCFVYSVDKSVTDYLLKTIGASVQVPTE